MKKYALLFLFVSFCTLHGQVNKNVNKGLFKLNALTPGASYEIGVGTNSTLNFDIDLAFAIAGGEFRSGTEFGVFPSLNGAYRYYYNFDRRLGKGKNISRNSANYFGSFMSLQSREPVIGNWDTNFEERTYFTLGAVYGFQRTYRRGFYWNLSFGPGIFFQKGEFAFLDVVSQNHFTEFGLVLNAKIGWVIGGNKK